jgi:hypothetical protein
LIIFPEIKKSNGRTFTPAGEVEHLQAVAFERMLGPRTLVAILGELFSRPSGGPPGGGSNLWCIFSRDRVAGRRSITRNSKNFFPFHAALLGADRVGHIDWQPARSFTPTIAARKALALLSMGLITASVRAEQD